MRKNFMPEFMELIKVPEILVPADIDKTKLISPAKSSF
jgi:hypothetical protein